MATTHSCVLGAFVFFAGVWGAMSPDVLSVFNFNPAMSGFFIMIGLLTLALEILIPLGAPLWTRIVGFIFLCLAVFGFAFTGPVFGLLPNTTYNNLLDLALALGFLYDGYVASKNPQLHSPVKVVEDPE